jgi:hypothetical protein
MKSNYSVVEALDATALLNGNVLPTFDDGISETWFILLAEKRPINYLPVFLLYLNLLKSRKRRNISPSGVNLT